LLSLHHLNRFEQRSVEAVESVFADALQFGAYLGSITT
jgi:hypothetical protein